MVRDDPTIRKVVLTRSRRFDLAGENVDVVPITSREGQMELARCREILVDRTPRAALDLPTSRTAHHYVHLGGGLPIGPAALSRLRRGSGAYQDLASDYRRVHAMLAASRADALARAAATPLGLHQLWLTGLPRHDLVTRAHEALPADLQRAEQALRDRLGGRRLLVLWPRPGRPVRTFSEDEREWLAAWCRRHDAVLGVREGAVDRARQPHADPRAARCLESVRAQRARPLGGAPRRRRGAHRRRRRGRRLPAHRPSAAPPASGGGRRRRRRHG